MGSYGDNKVFSTIGASNHSSSERALHDYYATDPIAVEKLLEQEKFKHRVWEPACGEGHLVKVLEHSGYSVRASDIINRGFPNTEVLDFFTAKETDGMDIITNPPYNIALEFIQHALDISEKGAKIAMLLKLTFLESQKRKAFFEKYPPVKLYVFSSRIVCAKNGDFKARYSSAIAYAWYIWEKGIRQDPVIKWI